jgi:excisionase family DNA binding protein
MARLLTPEQAAEFTGLALDTLAQWRSQRKGPPYIKLGRAVRYRADDLEKYFAAHTIVPLTDEMLSGRLAVHETKESGGGKTRAARRAGACPEAEQGRIV